MKLKIYDEPVRIAGVKTTGYYPPPKNGYKSQSEAAMEGGPLDCLGRPLRTLQQYPELANSSFWDHSGEESEVSFDDYVSIAVDKKLIPLGSVVLLHHAYFDEFGDDPVLFVACDVGSAIQGRHIDVCVQNKKKSYETTKSDVTVEIIGKVTKW